MGGEKKMNMNKEGLGDLINFLMITTGLFYTLPKDIIINILARLSVKELYLCRCVCKEWLNLINQPFFAKAYYDRQIQTRFYPYVFLYNSSQFFLIDNVVFDDSHQSHVRCHELKTLIDDLGGSSSYKVVDSENGLICLSSYTEYPYYICNPITGESTTLPKCPRGETEPLVTVLGFAPTSVEYKLIRLLSKTDRKRLFSSAEIYTLGSDRWRTIEDVPSIILPQVNSRVLVNGNFYWLAYCPKTKSLSILSLNVGSEKFIVIKPPIDKKIKVGMLWYTFNDPVRALKCKLIVSREHLYFIDDSVANKTVAWVMETDGAQQRWAKVLFSKEKVLGTLCCGFYDVVKLANGEFRVDSNSVERTNVHYYDHQKESVKKMKYGVPFSTNGASTVMVSPTLFSPKVIYKPSSIE